MKNFSEVSDFKKYYDKERKMNIWVLGYFGGGSLNISDTYTVGRKYSRENKVPMNTVKIDEIFKSSRYKGFKFVFSLHNQEVGSDVDTNNILDNVMAYLEM
jgi:hypothetical protein